MENSFHDTTNSVSENFGFKYIPEKEFDKIVMKVRERRAEHSWQKFCSVSSGLRDEDTDDDISCTPTLMETRNLNEDENQTTSKSEWKFPSILGPSRTRIETPAQFGKINYANDDVGCENLEDEIMRLCAEIENINGNNIGAGNAITNDDNADEMVDLNFNEEKLLRNIMDRTEEKVICEMYKQTVDKGKFDFLLDERSNNSQSGDEDDEKASKFSQAFPIVELKLKHTSELKPSNEDDDVASSNDVNVWSPRMDENRIRKNCRQGKVDVRRIENSKSVVGKSVRMRNDDYCAVLPSDNDVTLERKAQNVAKLKRVDANEKSHVDVKKVFDVREQLRRKQMIRNEGGVSSATLSIWNSRNSSKSKNPRSLDSEAINILLKPTRDSLTKISQYLDYLREICEYPPEMEDLNDLKKRQKRSTEFACRFARNHIYPIGRIGEELRIMPDNPMEIAEKVNSLFQEIIQATQSYLKYVEVFIYSSYPDKLSVLVDFIANYTKICVDKLAFDKDDEAVRRLLNKCTTLKKFLMINQNSTARFAKMPTKRPNLQARNSFAYGTSGHNLQPMKSPYEPVLGKPKNLRYSSSHASTTTSKNSKSVSKNVPKMNTRLRKSPSDVSTQMGRLARDDGSNESVDNELKVMEMIKNISQQQLEKIFGQFYMAFQPETIQNGPRVTSDIIVMKEKSNPANPTSTKSAESSDHVNKFHINKINEEAFREHLNYVQQMQQNPLYANEHVSEPWNLFARIADKMFDEMLDEVISEFDFGEKTFVENFLQSELQC